jgi:hypothetical protein
MIHAMDHFAGGSTDKRLSKSATLNPPCNNNELFKQVVFENS